MFRSFKEKVLYELVWVEESILSEFVSEISFLYEVPVEAVRTAISWLLWEKKIEIVNRGVLYCRVK